MIEKYISIRYDYCYECWIFARMIFICYSRVTVLSLNRLPEWMKTSFWNDSNQQLISIDSTRYFVLKKKNNESWSNESANPLKTIHFLPIAIKSLKMIRVLGIFSNQELTTNVIPIGKWCEFFVFSRQNQFSFVVESPKLLVL